MRRIAIAGIAHEALTFNPHLSRLQDFQVYRGAEVFDFPHVPRPSYDRFEAVPLLVANTATPGGVVDRSTYLSLRDEILERLSAAGPVDGVCLVLHGAMLVEGIGSGETDLAREVRRLIGPEPLIAARFDLHAILTDEFTSLVDLWTAYRTAPHRDIPETFSRAFGLLVDALEWGRRPQKTFIRLPLLLPGERAMTDHEPMRSLLQAARQIEADEPGISNLEVLVGFGWSDAPHSGASITVCSRDAESARPARVRAIGLAARMWGRRAEFRIPGEVVETADEAIDRAMAAPESTVFVTDVGDNPTAGATGDVPHFLSRLLAREDVLMREPRGAVLDIFDAGASAACFEAGQGATVSLQVGGKLDTLHGDPVPVSGVVEHLFRPSSPREVPVAVVRVISLGRSSDGAPAPGALRLLLPLRRKVFIRVADYQSAGIDLLAHKLVVVKQGYLFPELHDIAPREILALTPGFADMALERLPYREVQRPIYPLDADAQWAPEEQVASRS